MKIEGGVFSNSIEKKNNITVAEELMDTSEQPAGETGEERQCGHIIHVSHHGLFRKAI
jgi:hypothetical protein